MLLFLLAPAAFVAAAVFIAAVLVGPAVLAVRWLVHRRAVGFLVRGSFERGCVYAAGVATAMTAIVQSVLLAGNSGDTGVDAGCAVSLLSMAAPALIAAAPWV